MGGGGKREKNTIKADKDSDSVDRDYLHKICSELPGFVIQKLKIKFQSWETIFSDISNRSGYKFVGMGL